MMKSAAGGRLVLFSLATCKIIWRLELISRIRGVQEDEVMESYQVHVVVVPPWHQNIIQSTALWINSKLCAIGWIFVIRATLKMLHNLRCHVNFLPTWHGEIAVLEKWETDLVVNDWRIKSAAKRECITWNQADDEQLEEESWKKMSNFDEMMSSPTTAHWGRPPKLGRRRTFPRSTTAIHNCYYLDI